MSETRYPSGLTRTEYIGLPVAIATGVLIEFSSRFVEPRVSELNEQLLSLFGISLICAALVVLVWRAGANRITQIMMAVAIFTIMSAQLLRTVSEVQSSDGSALITKSSPYYEDTLTMLDSLVPATFILVFFALVFQISIANNRLSAQTEELREEAENRKDAEERTARREQQVRKIMENFHGFALIANRDGSYKDATPQVTDILGYELDELNDPDLLASLHVRERRTGAHEIEVRHKDGSAKLLFADHVDMLDEPMINGVLSTYVDITEARLIQDQKAALQHRLLQTQKMESLGVMAGGIAHDFNNALMGIMGYADLALVDMSPNSSPRHLIERIIEMTENASKIAQKILTYAGREQVHLASVEVSALVENLKELLGASVSDGTRIEYALAADLPEIEVDSRQIEQVVINLVTNASEASREPNSTIIVRTGLEALDIGDRHRFISEIALNAGRYVYLEVEDQGVGMDPAVVENAFDPFFSTKFTGRGLGLAAVLGIVNSHKGGIELDSSLGTGTRIRIYLPVVQREIDDDIFTPPDLTISNKPRNTVLVVDDDESVRLAVSIMLEHCGFTVRSAIDGIEALHMLEDIRDECKFILMDVVMPRMNGLAAHREIQKKGVDIPVVFMTGYSDQHLDFGEDSGGNRPPVLKKPFTFRALRYQLESRKLLKM